jgi:hypothetical protein
MKSSSQAHAKARSPRLAMAVFIGNTIAADLATKQAPKATPASEESREKM